MFFFFLIGAQSFDSSVKDMKSLRFYCPHCHNTSVEAVKHKQFITLFWVPVIPMEWHKQLRCTICGWRQDATTEMLNQMKNNPQ